MIDVFDPDLYLFNRDVGILRLVPIATPNEWIDADEDFGSSIQKIGIDSMLSTAPSNDNSMFPLGISLQILMRVT